MLLPFSFFCLIHCDHSQPHWHHPALHHPPAHAIGVDRELPDADGARDQHEHRPRHGQCKGQQEERGEAGAARLEARVCSRGWVGTAGWAAWQQQGSVLCGQHKAARW